MRENQYMIEKPVEERPPTEKSPGVPATMVATRLILPPVLCTIAFVLCVLFMVAPLSRIPDPVIQLQTPLGGLLARIGSWLPNDFGLDANAQASQVNSNYLEFLGLIALLFVIYGVCVLYIARLPAESGVHRQTRYLLWTGAALAGLIFVFTPAMLSHDILVYASYSRLLANYHANPYFAPIAAFPHDPYFPLNYWGKTVAAYGPLWLAVCGFLGFLAGPQPIDYVLAFRLFALAAHLFNIWLVTKTLREMGQSPRTITLGALLYAWNPLVLLESGLGGHNDVFMMTFLLLGVFLTVRAQQHGTLPSPRGYLPPLIAFTLAALVKFTTLPVIALFIVFIAWKAWHASRSHSVEVTSVHHWKPALSAAVISGITLGVIALVFYGPFWIGHSIYDIQLSFTTPPSALFAENSILRAILVWGHDHRLPADTMGSILIQIFSIRKIWDDINIAILGIMCIVGAIWMWHAPSIRTFTLAALAALGALLIVTPWFFDWYITWLIGLAAVSLPLSHSRVGRALLAFTLTFSASAFLTYLFKDGYPPFGIWTGLVCLTTIVPPLLAFLIAFITWHHTASKTTFERRSRK